MSDTKENDRTYTVTEFCPHCENEIEMQWDTDRLGFKAFCPVCGNRLMLCDECRHSGPDGGPIGPCDYDHETDTCRFNPRKTGFQPGDTVYVVERNEYDQPVEVSGYMFIAATCGFVIVSPFICALETAEDTLDCQARNTQYDFSADLRVYRKVDCFAAPEEAHDVLKVARGEADV